MPQPKEIYDKKVSFFKKAEKRLQEIAVKVQKKMWNKIAPILDLFDDVIEPDEATIKMINKIELAATKEYREEVANITEQVKKDFNRINTLNTQYFKSYSSGLEDRLKEGQRISEALMLERLGLRGETIAVDGFLGNFETNPEVLQRIKSKTFKATTGRISKERLTRELREVILETETNGIVQSQVNRFINDSYTQFDSITQQVRADRLGMRVALYANNLVDDSRCFCRNRFNKVFTVEEISKWKASTNSEKVSDGANCLAIYETTTYDPFVHRGGYNCRHVYRYVPKTVAVRFRPELNAYYDDLDAKGVDFI